MAFLKDLGLKRQEVIGKTCHEVFHKLDDKCITEDYICPLEDTLRTGKHSVTEHIHYRGDGEKIYLEISASPIKNEKGEAIQVVHVARDITKHKQMEEKMQREIKGLKKQLEKMNQKER